jgi:AcrR family transcriptional regulator
MMSGIPVRDRKAERRAETRAEIMAAAWEIAREQGLAAVSLREIGARVGMRAQSLYSYFDAKGSIYDAMFEEGNVELLRRVETVLASDGPPEARLRRGMHAFVDFATEDPIRAQLLFVRTIPGFEPSPQAYAPAVRVLGVSTKALAEVGITDPSLVDIWTALLAGLIQQQLANDPGGDRWTRHVDEIIDMFLAHAQGRSSR